jgi:glycine amidinotransferase/scyllo-inosamine-4-phosphate amidinotransferase 1
MPIRSRKNEWKANKYNLKNILDLTSDHLDSLYNLECIKNPNTLSLNETAPAFDAANILRANDNLLFLVSNSGNIKGAELLQDVLGNKGKVKIVKDIYSYMHIDSTIAFLREGLMLLNPSRVKSKDQLPFPFNTWDAIWAPQPVDIGHYPNYCNSSKWVSINLLSINSNLVVLEEHQTNLRKELKKYNIDCAMLPMRHSRTLGGCFHCVTLDLKRDD